MTQHRTEFRRSKGTRHRLTILVDGEARGEINWRPNVCRWIISMAGFEPRAQGHSTINLARAAVRSHVDREGAN